jgi:hypothetical protein
MYPCAGETGPDAIFDPAMRTPYGKQHVTVHAAAWPCYRVTSSTAPRWPRLVCAWPALLGAEERTKSAELELHQRHHDGDAHDPGCDEPGDPGVTIGDGGEQASRGAGQDRCNDANHSGDGPEGLLVTGPQALDDQSLRRRDAGQVGDEFWRAVEVVGP